jgi:hypothetical protein
MISYEASKQAVNTELYYTDDIEVFCGGKEGYSQVSKDKRELISN